MDIMDQWVGKSINLITGEKIVSLTSNSWVNENVILMFMSYFVLR
jgi:hypothetical protein